VRPILRFAAIYVAASVLVAAVLLVTGYPASPITWVGWALLLVLGLPLVLVAELAGDMLFRNRLARAAERSPRTLRFAYVFGAMLLIFACAILIARWVPAI
jgi:hypothetical protein